MTISEANCFGRTAGEWSRLAETGTAFLIERAKLGKVTSYTELNATLVHRTGLRGFDFERADERAAMGHLLWLIVEGTRPTTSLMLSALVHYLDQNDAGSGFYALARDYGLLPPNASASAKLEFWVGQVVAIHDYYGRSPLQHG